MTQRFLVVIVVIAVVGTAHLKGRSLLRSQEATIDFELFTRDARLTLFYARSFVSELGGSTLDPEHLLLGLLRVDPEVVVRFLGPADSAEALTLQVKERVSRGAPVPSSVEIPFSPDVGRVLRVAVDEASGETDRAVHPDHILLALLGRNTGVAVEVLRMHGVRETDVRLYLQTLRDKR